MHHRLFCFLLVFSTTAVSFAQTGESKNDKRFTADLLKSTLFARTTADQQFCDYVIQKQEDGTIPPRLIYGIYRKALTKDQFRRFAYFKAGLEIVCEQEGIVLEIPANTAKKWVTTPLQFFASFKSLFKR